MARLILSFMVLVSTGAAQGESRVMCQEAFAKIIAVQQIEYLRRAYARATDQIGRADEASVEAGRAVYLSLIHI